MTIQSRLAAKDAENGNALDTFTTPDKMRALLRERREIRQALEGLRTISEPAASTEADRQAARELTTAPYRFIGLADDGTARFES